MMFSNLSRRGFVLGAATRVATNPFAAPDALAALERRHGGRLGVFAVDAATERTLAHRADERFTLCSTVKFPLAAFVLAQCDAGTASLTEILPYGAQDLRALGYPNAHCPITGAHVGQGGLTVATLCQAAVTDSDNLAANLLFQRFGGPPALTRFLRSLNDTVTRSDRIEPALNTYKGDLDTTTPRAIVTTARQILLGNTLRQPSRALLESWMIDCVTGLQRLRAGTPRTWIAADKTGTGNDEANDLALFRPPGRKPLLVAAYYNAPHLPVPTRERALREVGQIFRDWASQ